MNFTKLKENKLLLFSIIASMIACFSFAHLSVAIILALLTIVFVAKLNFEDGFIFIGYISNFCMCFGYKYIFYPIICVGMFILTFKGVAINKSKWSETKKSTKTIMMLCLAYLLIQPIVYLIIFHSVKGFGVIVKLFMLLAFFVLLYFSHGQVDRKKFTKYFVWGIFISCALGCLGFVTGYITYEVFLTEKQTIWRFTGISPHTNVMVRIAILAMCLVLINLFNEPKKIHNYLLVAALTLIGMATGSKSFLILFAVLVMVVTIYSFVKSKNKKLWWKIFGVSLVVFAILILCAIPYLKMMYKRFVGFMNGTSILNVITTGRVNIWKDFCKDLVSNPLYVLFGKSFMGDIPVDIGVHNTYLALFYQYGVIGTIILAIYLFTVLKNITGYKRKFSYFIPIILMLFSGMSEDHIFTHIGALYVCFAIMFMYSKNKVECDEKALVSNQVYLFAKRSFDIVISIIGIIVAIIPMAIVALIIKLTSKGPVIFKDKRVGKDGKIINVYKFRSMFVDAESRLEQYLTKEQYELWKTERKIENDPRITKIGKFIRKTSIDELPQLFNILKGDLSLIGNRPISKLEYDTWFTDEEKQIINTMRPGLTGYWQVYGRSEVSWASGKRKKMCMYYVENPSFWFDVKLFFATFITVLFRRGAK